MMLLSNSLVSLTTRLETNSPNVWLFLVTNNVTKLAAKKIKETITIERRLNGPNNGRPSAPKYPVKNNPITILEK